MIDHRQHAPATVRNRDFILDVLRDVLPMTGVILEIASGSGEHVVHFARNLPSLVFQPSDPEPDALLSVAAWMKAAEVTNVRAPIVLDASRSLWPIASADGIICINMVHISPGRDGRIDQGCGCDTSFRVTALSLWSLSVPFLAFFGHAHAWLHGMGKITRHSFPDAPAANGIKLIIAIT